MAAKKKSRSPKATRPHMPGYLSKTKNALLPWKWAEDRLKRSRQYWIATTRPDGRPHVMVIWALWLDGFLYFSTGSASQKARNLAGNSHCTICTEDAAEGVILEGVSETEGEIEQIRKVLVLYGKKYKFDMSGMADDLLNLKEPVFRLRPITAFGLWEKKFSTTATRWLFENESANRRQRKKH